MFNDRSFDVTEFASIATSSTTTMSSTTQTKDADKKCQGIQKIELRDSEVQTMNVESKTPTVDYEKLAAFLKKITPDILDALDKPFIDNANDIDDDALTIPKLQAQLYTKFSTTDESIYQKKISAVKWSTNGGTLAISYCTVTHKAWCDHFSEIKLFEFARDNELRKNSSITYDTNACVSCLSYHPTEPSLLCAGLFNGDVILWNLTGNNPTMPTNVCTHDDTISSLNWRPITLVDSALLVTSSSDGYIMFHKLSANFTNINTQRRCKIIKEHNPDENLRPRSAGGSRERAVEAGLNITCLDFSLKNPIIFIVGTLCGGLYKCSTESDTLIQGDDSLIDPVIDQYDRCNGSVTCVKCSPTNTIFISADTNKQMRIFDLMECSCLQVINVEYTVTGLQWIINNQDVILIHGANPIVKCFKITNDKITQKFQIECSIINSACLDINKNRSTVCIADSQNNVEIWKIPKIIE